MLNPAQRRQPLPTAARVARHRRNASPEASARIRAAAVVLLAAGTMRAEANEGSWDGAN